MKYHDGLLQADYEQHDDARGCSYQGYDFGANYPDSDCVDGYLWDMDSGDADGDGWAYTHGGEDPCPWCNHAEWMEGCLESLENDGYSAAANGQKRESVPTCGRFAHETERMQAAWIKGWDEGATTGVRRDG